MRANHLQRLLVFTLLVSGCGDLQSLSLGSDLNRPRTPKSAARDAGETDRDSGSADAEADDDEHEDEPQPEDDEHDEER
ncbi:MAG TPA: hypothetical protein VJR89_31980 [Polyangiales bacterium]|nr:hypothetical protein [Polyangiales bacterium]